MFEKIKFSKKSNSQKTLLVKPVIGFLMVKLLIQLNFSNNQVLCYLEIELPSRLVVCKTRFYLFDMFWQKIC